ncbi:SNF2-related protein [Pseudonocardia phyllosphaerae]|uniref:SNF2-related protein n=1 Tax=Pseudonocardia phyllosphaerae TaxID=3390502 RepID=UPI00397DEEEC
MTVTTVGFAAGSAVVVRDEEWVVTSCDRAGDGWRVRCSGSSELVRGTTATFYSTLDDIRSLDPAEAVLIADDSPRFRRSRLWVESVLRKTPRALHEPGLTVGQEMLLDPLDYQRQAVALALDPARLRPRLLIADAVGLGKTLEIGMILAELSRRGRAERVLVVTPRHVLEQMQYELWTRFSLPLVRLDSDGIQRVRQELPASRNPFTYFPKVIVSIDTLKSARYRAHLENHHWDVVVIDESHNVTNSAAQRSELARVLAARTEALILASATPHNGKPESFANLINLLEPTAIVDPTDFAVDDIRGLFVRRHRHSPDVAREVGNKWAERLDPEVVTIEPTPAEDAIAAELSSSLLHPETPHTQRGGQLVAWQLAKAFLSSPAAFAETLDARRATLDKDGRQDSSEAGSLRRLRKLADEAESGPSSKLDALVAHLREIGIGRNSDTRVVLFSERIATLDWLHQHLPAALGMPESAFAVLHGKLPDQAQMEIVESFQLAASPLRILITGDVASEGVNLHKRCHNLVHVDIPWSLIRIEQRNGRIDRYGQEHPPRIVALALATADERFSGDVRVITRLLAKEHAAHKALGDAASLMHLHDIGGEETAVRDALMAGTPIDEVVPDPHPPGEIADDAEFDDLFLDAGELVPDPPQDPSATAGLFDSQVAFLREALSEAFDGDPASRIGWREHHEDRLVELVPPKDLMARLRVLPKSYLDERAVREKLLLAVDRETGEEYLRKASDGKTTQWPAAHYLSPLHPVLDWAVDRALTRLGRNEVPVVSGTVEHPVAIMLGTLSNSRGQVVMRSVIGMAFFAEGAPPVALEDAEGIIRDAGLRDGAVNPHGPNDPLDVSPYAHTVPEAVEAMRQYMGTLRKNRGEELVGPLRAAARAIRSWRSRSEDYARSKPPAQAARVRKRIEEYGRQADELVDSLSARRDPMVRVLLLLVPNGEAR